MRARPPNKPLPRGDGDTYDHTITDTVYEVLLDLETQETFAVRWAYGHLTGVLDLGDREVAPTTAELATLPYETPAPSDGANLERDKALWVVVARFRRFVSAEPPQWVLDRQAVQRTEYKEDSNAQDG